MDTLSYTHSPSYMHAPLVHQHPEPYSAPSARSPHTLSLKPLTHARGQVMKIKTAEGVEGDVVIELFPDLVPSP